MTIQTIIAEGTRKEYSLPPYVGTPVVKVNGVAAPFTIVKDGVISITTLPAQGATLTFEYTEALTAVAQAVASVSNALRLRKFKAAVAKTRAGQARTTFLFLGDSWTVGSGASGVSGYQADGRKFNSSVQLATLLNKYFVPANANGIIGGGNVGAYFTFDPRFVVISGTFSTTAPLNTAIGNGISSNTNGGQLNFTPTQPVDTFIITTARSPSQGSFTLSVNGGAVLATVVAGGANGVTETTVTATLGTNTLNFLKTSAANTTILSIRAYNSAVKELDVIQAGHSGAIASTFTGSTNAWDGLNEIIALAPHLTYIALTINDWVAATDMTVFKANIQLLINAAKISGDVILGTGGPSDVSIAPIATQQAYVDAIKELATLNDLVFINQYQRFGSYAEANALGLYSDVYHGNMNLYGDLAQGIFKEITAI